MNKTQAIKHRLIQKHGKLVLAAHAQMRDDLGRLDMEELSALERACHTYSQTNCAWFDYDAAKELLSEIGIQLQKRQQAGASK